MSTDFTGFTFDGVHSSQLNIYRVSDGDRYSEEILPEIENNTIEPLGRDGVYYYGTFYKSRNFEIQIAFDNVSEEQYRNIRRLFGQKKVCNLIFDERPYKVYKVVLESPITLDTVCFDEVYKTVGEARNGVRVTDRTEVEVLIPSLNEEGEQIYDENNEPVYTTSTETQLTYEQVTPWIKDYSRKRRVYKGEGTITLVAYDPFARQQFKTLEEYTAAGYDNVSEWSTSSGILTSDIYTNNYDNYMYIVGNEYLDYTDTYNGEFQTYNPGDIDVPYYLFIPYVNNSITQYSGDNVLISSGSLVDLTIEPFEKSSNNDYENGILINTKAELIEGVIFDYNTNSWIKTGNIYNKYILGGSFGKIYKGNGFNYGSQKIRLNCAVNISDETVTNAPIILYNYLYF